MKRKRLNNGYMRYTNPTGEYRAAYHSDEDDKDSGLSIRTLIFALSGFVGIYGIIMIDHYQKAVSEFFSSVVYGILKFFWI